MESYHEEDICLCDLKEIKGKRSVSGQLQEKNFVIATEREIVEVEADNSAEGKNLPLDKLPFNKVKKNEFNAKNDQCECPCSRDESKVLMIRSDLRKIVNYFHDQSQRLDTFMKQLCPVGSSDCCVRAKSCELSRKKSKMLNSQKENGKEKTRTETSEAKNDQCVCPCKDESNVLMIFNEFMKICNAVHDRSQQLEIILKQSCPLHSGCCVRAKSSEPSRKKLKMLNSEKENGKEKTSTETTEAQCDQCECPPCRVLSKACVLFNESGKIMNVLRDQSWRLKAVTKQLCPLHSDCCVRAKSREPSRRKSKMLNSEKENGKEKTSTETRKVSASEDEMEH